MQSHFLFERLANRMAEKQSEYDTRILLTAVLNAVDSSVDDRIDLLFKTIAGVSDQDSELHITQEELILALKALMDTNQLPIRSMTREKKKYPYNVYQPSTASFLATRAVEEVVKCREKSKC